MTGAVFVLGVSCWFLLKKRNTDLSLRSIKVASIAGIIATLVVMGTGDQSGVTMAREQPMKLAAAEGLQQGGTGAPFSIVPGIEVPKALSILATHDPEGYVPGIQDLLNGYTLPDGTQSPSAKEKINRGKKAIQAFGQYRQLRKTNPQAAQAALDTLNHHQAYMGYGYLQNKEQLVPPIELVYWSFRLMVGFGSFLFALLIVLGWMAYKQKLHNQRWLLALGVAAIPMVYVAGQAGWIVAEVGRQPWAIQDLLPVGVAVSQLSATNVMVTFFLFLVLFTLLLIAEVRIMCKAISSYKQNEISKP